MSLPHAGHGRYVPHGVEEPPASGACYAKAVGRSDVWFQEVPPTAREQDGQQNEGQKEEGDCLGENGCQEAEGHQISAGVFFIPHFASVQEIDERRDLQLEKGVHAGSATPYDCFGIQGQA